MKHLLILAGAAAFAFAGPGMAKPGNDHGNPHGYGLNGPVGYGVGGCPPGLRNKGCMPPGQAKKLYNIGQRFPRSYGTPWSYNQIPYDVRRQYGLSPYGNYYYGDGYLYRVDPRTQLIQQVVSALLYR
jgi:hypothetical protein